MRPDDHHWSEPFPDWVEEFRPEQEQAVEEIMAAYRTGARVVFLDAPTGAGKTLIGEMVRRRLREPTAYVCTTKNLQQQFIDDFPYAKVIKGRANYPTLNYPDRFEAMGAFNLSAGDCNRMRQTVPACGLCDEGKIASIELMKRDHSDVQVPHCNWCHPVERCPYRMAKSEALSSRLVVANTAYFLNECNHIGTFGEQQRKGGAKFSQFPFWVIDEADELESEIMRFVEYGLSKRFMTQYQLPEPKRKTKLESWVEWGMEVKPILDDRWKDLADQYLDAEARNDEKMMLRLGRQLRTLEQKRDQLPDVVDAMKTGEWVYTGYERGNVEFKPVRVAEYAPNVLWRHSERFLLMSATIIAPAQMAFDLGLEHEEWRAVRVPSSFPVKNRRIYVNPVANMTAKTFDSEAPKMVAALTDILDRHPRERILVHTVSYKLSAFLAEHLDPYRAMTYTSSKESHAKLEMYLEQPDAVLLAPSFERGIDLPDDACRVIVVAKVPYPYLGDKQVSARLYGPGGQGWYAMHTVRSLVQMTGRGVRHAEDRAVSYILDSQFVNRLWRQNHGMVPKWWGEALVWGEVPV